MKIKNIVDPVVELKRMILLLLNKIFNSFLSCVSAKVIITNPVKNIKISIKLDSINMNFRIKDKKTREHPSNRKMKLVK